MLFPREMKPEQLALLVTELDKIFFLGVTESSYGPTNILEPHGLSYLAYPLDPV